MNQLLILLEIILIKFCFGFSAFEHRQIGEEAYAMILDKFTSNDKIDNSKERSFNVENPFLTLTDDKISFSYGDLIALCADYLGDKKSKVSEGGLIKHMDAIYETIKDKQEILNNLMNHLANEELEVAIKGGIPSDNFHDKHNYFLIVGSLYGAMLNKQQEGVWAAGGDAVNLLSLVTLNSPITKDVVKVIDKVTFGWSFLVVTLILQNDMTNLAMEGVDHFSNGFNNQNLKSDSGISYNIVHEFAINLAAKGQLVSSLVANSLADHFLTDRFSAGHIRTPRMLMREYCNMKGAPLIEHIGDLLSNCQHDEDNNYGVTASIGGREVFLKGDDHLLNPEMVEGKKLAILAVKQSLLDIIDSYHSGKKINSKPLDLTPDKVVSSTFPSMFKEESWSESNYRLMMRFPIPEKRSQIYIPIDKSIGGKVLCVYAALTCKVFPLIPMVKTIENKIEKIMSTNIGRPMTEVSTLIIKELTDENTLIGLREAISKMKGEKTPSNLF
jgi:hypothetical protein